MNWGGAFTGWGVGVGLILFWAFVGYVVGNYKGNGDYMKTFNWTLAVELIGIVGSTVLIVGIALLVR